MNEFIYNMLFVKLRLVKLRPRFVALVSCSAGWNTFGSQRAGDTLSAPPIHSQEQEL